MFYNWPDRAQIRLKTNIVLEFVDNFTHKLLSPCRMEALFDSLRVKPTKYSSGTMVFCNLLEAPHQIVIHSDLYQPQCIELTDKEKHMIESGGFISRLVRLEPSVKYALPKWATIIEGDVPTREDQYTVSLEGLSASYRLKKDYIKKSPLSIHLTTQEVMRGRWFYEVESHPRKAFQIIEKQEAGFIIQPEPENQLEAHDLIVELKPIFIDSNKHFFFILPNVESGTHGLKIFQNGEKVAECQIESGQWNNIGSII